MTAFRKKPVVIQAEQFDQFSMRLPFPDEHPPVCCLGPHGWYIQTLEGIIKLSHKDWVIKGVKGEFYPCKPDVFEQTYEIVEESL